VLTLSGSLHKLILSFIPNSDIENTQVDLTSCVEEGSAQVTGFCEFIF